MVKRHKRSLTLAALVLLLAQVFLMTFCNITAIAVTKEESSGSLFDNEIGNASVSYEETSTERLKWTVHLTKATQETATRFMVEVTGDGQAVTPENVQVLTKSNPTMNFAAGNGAGQITAGISETAATTTGSAVITFDTNRSYTAMTVKPKLIADVNPATDLLAGNTGKSFTIPQVATSESTSENSAVAASEAPVSESSATEATSSTEVAVSDVTSSTEQEATTDSTEETEEADVEDEVVLNDSFSAQDIQPRASDYTSLKFNKIWDFGDVDPTSLTEEEKTIEIQVMRRIKTDDPDTNPNPWEAYGDPVDLVAPEKNLEWHMLPAYENKVPYEYTVKELPSPYYEITSEATTPSAIDSLTTVQNNSSTEWYQTNPSYIVSRNTDGSWLIWTADHVSDADRQAFAKAIVAFGENSKEKQPYKDFAGLGDYTTSNITWVEGDVSALGITITVDETENEVHVTLDFGHSNVWTQFMYGTHSTKRVNITNKYIPQNKMTIAKTWDDSSNVYKTRKNIQVVLQQSLDGGTNWSDYTKTNADGTIEGILEITTKMTGNNFSQKDIEVPSRVGGKAATYRIIERVWNGSEYVDEVGDIKNRIEGYANPVYSPESTASSDTLTVTNTLLTRDFNFTKFGNDGETILPGVSFKLTGDNGYTSGDEVVKSDEDGNVNFSELPIGHYTLTETDTVAGYQAGGPWTFDVKDVNGKLVIVWQDGTEPSDIKIINTLKPFDLTVNKTDDQQKALEGAEFTLTKEEDDSFKIVLPGENGSPTSKFEFKNLTPGTYFLEETNAPDGYRELTTPIKIVIDKFGKVTIDDVEQKDVLIDGADNNQITLSVANDPKAPLPSTGGPGTLLFSLIGMLALGATGLYFYFRKDQEVA